MSIAEKLSLVAENQEKVFDAGRKKEYDIFWDNYQQKGARRSYINGFYGAAWTDENFKPKYDIIVEGSGGWMFQNAKISKLDVKLDLSGCTNVQSMFANSSFIRLPELDVSGCGDLKSMFHTASKLKKISCIVLGKNQTFTNTFSRCTSLENVKFAGDISRSVDFSSCPLEPSSIVGIIMKLEYFYGTEFQDKYTLSLSEACWKKADAWTTPYEYGVTGDMLMDWKQYTREKGWLI